MTVYEELVARGLIAQVTDEEEIREIAEDSIRKVINDNVEYILNEEVRFSGYNRLIDAITPKMLDEVSNLVKVEENYIINKVVERIAKGLKISSSDVVTALLALSKED